jgi:uncharacterized LabA/DUF88 family protein
MARVMFFVDGFNVYHSLKDKPDYHKYLWLDLQTLAKRHTRKQDTLVRVYYFSAYATWRPQSMKRHRLLVDALENSGVIVVMGRFKDKERYCPRCRTTTIGKEEKQTDVNIAMHLFQEAFLDNYDTAMLVTADTDLDPAVEGVRRSFPEKRFGVLFPMDRWATELRDACHFWRKIKRSDLNASQFPNHITLPSGVILSRPPTWT